MRYIVGLLGAVGGSWVMWQTDFTLSGVAIFVIGVGLLGYALHDDLAAWFAMWMLRRDKRKMQSVLEYEFEEYDGVSVASDGYAELGASERRRIIDRIKRL